jgi:hypothetical protein
VPLRVLVPLALSAALFNGCGKPQPVTPSSALKALKDQAAGATACRGRAWVSVKSAEQKASFSGVVVLDRADPQKPRLRIEALDPVGGLHHLMLVDGARDTLDWADFDGGLWRSGKGQWRGIAIRMLPHLLMGSFEPAQLAAFGFTAPQVSAAEGAEAVTFRRSGSAGDPLVLGLGWVTPGPRLLLSSVSTSVKEGQGLRHVQVVYGRFGESRDHNAPQDVTLTVEPDFELKLAWREREWMAEAPAADLFQVPEERKAGMRRHGLP